MLRSDRSTAALQAIGGRHFDVAVIGGGINGTATAERLSLMGHRVLLVEKADFGSGSSSRSSRIMHCGLNYLAAAADARAPAERLRNLWLARKMMQERARLHAALPGRLAPREFVIPLREDEGDRPWLFDLAFRMLRLLGGYGLPINYRRYSGAGLRSHPLYPYLGEKVTGLVSFTELVFDWPERICVDYALKAAEQGADVLNYTAVSAVKRCENGWLLTLENRLGADLQIDVSASHVVNFTGIDSDRLNAAALTELPNVEKTVTPNKGCHLALRLPAAFQGIGILRRNALGHLFLAVPWRDFHIFGPTETIVTGEPGPARVEAEDISALLGSIHDNLPGITVEARDILFQWAGYRPATYMPGNPRGAWLRRIHALHRMPFERNRQANKNAPKIEPENGGQAGRDRGGWFSMSWGRLADHGITANDIARQLPAASAARQPATPPLSSAPDRERALFSEGAMTLSDVIFGRLGLGWSADLGRAEAEDIARMMAGDAGQTEAARLLSEYDSWLMETFGQTARAISDKAAGSPIA